MSTFRLVGIWLFLVKSPFVDFDPCPGGPSRATYIIIRPVLGHTGVEQSSTLMSQENRLVSYRVVNCI
jgi:hypothetical protein